MNRMYFKEQVLPLKDKFFRYAFSIVKSSEDADDLVQETLIKIWNSVQKKGDIQNVEAWGMTTIRNMSFDLLRSSRVRKTDRIESFHVSAVDTKDPHSETERNEVKMQLDTIIAGLPDHYSQVIHLRDIEGHSYEEIGKILKISESQVKSHLFRARQKVKKQLIKVQDYGL